MHDILPTLHRGLLLLALIGAIPAHAEIARPARGAVAERELTIVNNSDRAMNEIYISPSSTDAWGDDRLGEATLASGRSLRLRLGRTGDCSFDVQVIYDDASREQQLGVDTCRQRQAKFTGAGAQAAPSVLDAHHSVTLLNASPRTIQQVFISPAEASQWGDDLLPSRSISVGDHAELTYNGACAADLRVVFENRAAEERRGLDLCATPSIIIRPGWTTADTVPVPQVTNVELTNASGHPLAQFLLTPDGADKPVPELLAGAVLADGGSIRLTLVPGTGCRFSGHVVFQDTTPPRDIEGLDLCANPSITVAP